MDREPDGPRAAVEHEFTDEQNGDLHSVASHAFVWGVVCTIAGVVCLGVGIPNALGVLHGGTWKLLVPAGVVDLAIGITFILTGRDFKAAVATSGCDISHVMRGLAHLSRALLVQIVVALIAVAFIVTGGALVGTGH